MFIYNLMERKNLLKKHLMYDLYKSMSISSSNGIYQNLRNRRFSNIFINFQSIIPLREKLIFTIYDKHINDPDNQNFLNEILNLLNYQSEDKSVKEIFKNVKVLLLILNNEIEYNLAFHIINKISNLANLKSITLCMNVVAYHYNYQINQSFNVNKLIKNPVLNLSQYENVPYKKLKSLDNEIDYEANLLIKNKLNKIHTLKIYLNNRYITDSLPISLQSFSCLSNLKLDLSENYLNDNALTKLTTFFRKKSDLTKLSLNLSGCTGINDSNIGELFRSIGLMINLTTLKLNISGTRIKDSGVSDLMNSLLKIAKNISVFSLNISKLHINYRRIYELSFMIKKFRMLSCLKLKLVHLDIDDSTLCYLIYSLSSLKDLYTLIIDSSNNQIENSSLGNQKKSPLFISISLMKMLSNFTLNLSSNRIGSKETKFIKSIDFLENLKIVNIDLRDNYIDTDYGNRIRDKYGDKIKV